MAISYRSGMWVATVGISEDVEVQEVSASMDPMEREHMTALMDTSEIATDNTFVKCKVKLTALTWISLIHVGDIAIYLCTISSKVVKLLTVYSSIYIRLVIFNWQ